jgi:uncharacterized protein YcaQ
MSPPAPYPLDALRAVALHAQRLEWVDHDRPHPTSEGIEALVEALGCVQIDTLHVVQRSQYLVLWSRLGAYEPADFDRLIFDPADRRLFEYWGHAASVIPLTRYRLYTPAMHRRRETSGNWWKDWLDDPNNRATVDRVRTRITEEGPLKTADFAYDGPKRDSWWDWKPAKRALEHLFGAGELMIANRVNFQRVYDLRKRVLPEWVDVSPMTHHEANRALVEHGAQALGVFRGLQVAEYAYLKRNTARPAVEALIESGDLVEIEGELADGTTADLLAHRDTLPLLERAAAGELAPTRTTFLSPFDSLFWARDRDEDLWNFRQVLEAYKRAEDRIWGYFCLPILHRGRLVGRFDPSLDRSSGLLTIKALHLEPGVEPSDELAATIAGAMREFMDFHAATDVVIEMSDPAGFGDRVVAKV